VTSRITAVCAVHRILDDPGGTSGRTAIDKRPLPGAVRVTRTGLVGDLSCDTRHHGGPNQAVYAYSDEDAEWWAGELGRAIPPGLFGENLRTSGIDLQAVVIGERWRIGDGDGTVTLEVTKPRTPCETFRRRMDEPRWVKRFTQAGRPGAYLRVLAPGTVETGQDVTRFDLPPHGVTLEQAFRHDDPVAMSRLLVAAESQDLDLDHELHKRASLAAARA
jgi:MOSC domain-containing protein YiiM